MVDLIAQCLNSINILLVKLKVDLIVQSLNSIDIIFVESEIGCEPLVEGAHHGFAVPWVQ